MKNTKLIFPDGFFYECKSCGECCRRNWQILPEDDKIELLTNFARDIGIVGDALIDDPVSNKKIIKTTGKNGCVFLDDKNLCRVHAALGFEAKTLMCQTFPFKPVELSEDRYYVRLSFACSAVRHNWGPPVKEYSQSVMSYIKRGFVAGTLKDFPIWFAAPASENTTPLLIDEDALLFLNEEFIFPRISDGINGNFFKNVWGLLFDIVNKASENKENLISKDTIKKSAELQKVEDVSNAEENKFSAGTKFAGKKNLYYAIFAGYEFVGREETAAAIKLFNLLNLVRGKGVLRTKYGRVDLSRALNEVKFSKDEKSDALLRRYFRHIVESGWMLIKPSDGLWVPTVINSWALLALFYGLIVRFAKIFASLEKRNTTSFSDIDHALTVVEVEYVSHISRSWLFLNRRVFAKIFSRLVESSDFVSVILSDED